LVTADPIEELRTLAAARPAHPPMLAPYLEKVRSRAYTVTDLDVEELTAAGLSQDEIFEATIGAVIAEGLRRLDAGDGEERRWLDRTLNLGEPCLDRIRLDGSGVAELMRLRVEKRSPAYP